MKESTIPEYIDGTIGEEVITLITGPEIIYKDGIFTIEGLPEVNWETYFHPKQIEFFKSDKKYAIITSIGKSKIKNERLLNNLEDTPKSRWDKVHVNGPAYSNLYDPDNVCTCSECTSLPAIDWDKSCIEDIMNKYKNLENKE